MEDAHTHILTMADDKDASYFAVYDGHGGSKVATHVSRNLHRQIVRRPEYKNREYEEAIVQGFLECDDKMRNDESLKDEMSGATAITALLRGTDLYVGNAGDSRCIASVNGQAEALSTDHKPSDPLERERIEKAGGFVEFNRVNGNLALSRAVGDFAFKSNQSLKPEDQIVSGSPEVQYRIVDKDWEFILLACDGIWDVLTNQEVADFVVRRIAEGLEPETICEELMTRCLAPDCSMGGLGCDNMTVILVCFLHHEPYDRLIDRCSALVKTKIDARTNVIDEDSSTDELDDDMEDEPFSVKEGSGDKVENAESVSDNQMISCTANNESESKENVRENAKVNQSVSKSESTSDSLSGFQQIQSSIIPTENTDVNLTCKDTIEAS